jgi:hypothetical protein
MDGKLIFLKEIVGRCKLDSSGSGQGSVVAGSHVYGNDHNALLSYVSYYFNITNYCIYSCITCSYFKIIHS